MTDQRRVSLTVQRDDLDALLAVLRSMDVAYELLAVVDGEERRGYVVTLPHALMVQLAAHERAIEVLVREWEGGDVTADVRPFGNGFVWVPVSIHHGTVEKREV